MNHLVHNLVFAIRNTTHMNDKTPIRAIKPIFIAVAGAGQIGKRHIELILANPRAALHSIIDPSDASKTLAAQLGVTHWASLDGMLSMSVNTTQYSANTADSAYSLPALPAGMVLATPNHLHVEQAVQCLKAGVATLVEKPIATTVAAAQQLVTAASASTIPVMIGHHRRHSGIMASACEVLASGVLGRLVSVVGTAMLYKADNEGYFDPEWRRTAGGGPILLNLIHDIGNLRSLCGEISAVHAFSSHATRGFAVEDTAAISLRFTNGALGSFMLSDTTASSRSWEHTSGEDPRYHLAATQDDDCYLVAGTMGSLSIPSMRLKTYASMADQSWHKALQTRVVAVPAIDPMAAQIEHFCDVIEGRCAPLVSAQDGLQNLAVVEAIARSAQTGLTVTIG